MASANNNITHSGSAGNLNVLRDSAPAALSAIEEVIGGGSDDEDGAGDAPVSPRSQMVVSPPPGSGSSSAALSPPPKKPVVDDGFRHRTMNLLRTRAPNDMDLVKRLAVFNKISNLFVEASDLHGIDQPLCRDCFKRTERMLHAQFNDLREQAHSYKSALQDIERLQASFAECDDRDNQHGAGNHDKNGDEEEAALENEVRQLEEQVRQARWERVMWENRLRQTQALVSVYLDTRNTVSAKVREKEQSFFGQVASIESLSLLMQRLSRSSVLNDTFHIWFDGHFGCINGCRLGKLPSVHVDWIEINAAWGFATLLLKTLARTLQVSFEDWEPVPAGVNSQLYSKKENVSYDLSGSSDFSVSRLFWYRKFDAAIVGFVTCVAELVHRVSQDDPSFIFPYQINKDRIGATPETMVSVRYQFSDEQTWTRSLKYVLTLLKFIIAWISKKKLESADMEKRTNV